MTCTKINEGGERCDASLVDIFLQLHTETQKLISAQMKTNEKTI